MSSNQVLPKTMKTAFICVHASNEVTETSEFHDKAVGDVVEYSFNDILSILEDWASTKKLTYYAIEHDKDDSDWKGKHYHIVLNFQGISTSSKQVRKRFPFGYIETCRSLRRCVQYLVHLNDLTKQQYKWENVVHNDEKGLVRFQIKRGGLSFDEILQKIGNGEIREYDVINHVDPVTYSKKKRQIDNAVQYYITKRMQNPERTEEDKIRTIVIQGPTRLGKSDIAKALCKIRNKSFCMSGSGNDPWEPYRGQDCMILDDLRDSSFSLSTMIKMLDPYNSTPIQRRYHNALFLGDEIIISTNEEIWKFYSGETVEDESRKAFFSRIELILDFFEGSKGESLFRLVRYNKALDRFERDNEIYLYYPYYRLTNRGKAEFREIVRDSRSTEDMLDFYWVQTKDSPLHYNAFDERNMEYMPNDKLHFEWKYQATNVAVSGNPVVTISIDRKALVPIAGVHIEDIWGAASISNPENESPSSDMANPPQNDLENDKGFDDSVF